jgi:predicted unusual protein kinase regulating ubiquinone biosynthesis (AarF/ABC1/UbiB family)
MQLAPSAQPINRQRLESEFDRLLRQYYSMTITEVNFSKLVYEVLQVARNNKVRIPGNLGLCAKAIANLEGIARSLDPEFNIPNKIRPMMTEVFQRQLVGEAPVAALLRTALDVKNLSLQSPRQIEMLLDRVTSETLQWNLNIRELDPLRRTVDSSANRLSFSIVIGALIMGAAIISSTAQNSQVFWVSDVLFAAASLVGLWLLVSIWRSGRLR